MSVPPPLHDPAHLETRLLLLAELLERAVAEVRRTAAEIRPTVATNQPATDQKET